VAVGVALAPATAVRVTVGEGVPLGVGGALGVDVGELDAVRLGGAGVGVQLLAVPGCWLKSNTPLSGFAAASRVATGVRPQFFVMKASTDVLS
jgi:hypothetical protein